MNSTDQAEQLHRKEADFHDQWALSTPLEDIAVTPAFEAATAPENRLILSLMGDLRGKRILDIGAGLGESSVYFALHGARVTCTDLSPQMVQTAMALAARHGVRIEGVVSAGESLNVPSEAFDLVYIANTIHHVNDRRGLFGEMRRALRPGGRFFAWDPLAYNPAIAVYRKMASAVRTQDERPLTFRDLRTAREFFVDVRHREFWIAALVLFVKYYAVDRVHPSADQYWKRILKETESSLWWWHPFHAVDTVLTRLPLVRRLAWNIVMWGRKPGV